MTQTGKMEAVRTPIFKAALLSNILDFFFILVEKVSWEQIYTSVQIKYTSRAESSFTFLPVLLLLLLLPSSLRVVQLMKPWEKNVLIFYTTVLSRRK